jgi:hypothetical protein
MRTGVVWLFALAVGCHFEVPSVELDEPEDAAEAMAEDLSASPDLAHAPPDLTPPFAPSHVDSPPLGSGTLAGVTRIDTTTLMLELMGGGMVPAGVTLTRDSHGYAVLATGSWLVDQDVKVAGSAPLVVVATGDVNVLMTIHAEASYDQPGPGGAAPEMGDGKGGRGVEGSGANGDDSGGGGGSFGAMGGAGGSTTSILGNLDGGAVGAIYGGTAADFLGGSGGGNGGHFESCTMSRGLAGAGGGVVQISSATSITVSGTINAGGGGGRGGCQSQASAGGGGGSGGTIFLEAPMLSVTGKLVANGTDQAAGGGSGSASGIAGGGGKGGGGYCDPALSGGGGERATNSGGGGGGGGRTWLRAHGVPDSGRAQISPPAGVLTDF